MLEHTTGLGLDRRRLGDQHGFGVPDRLPAADLPKQRQFGVRLWRATTERDQHVAEHQRKRRVALVQLHQSGGILRSRLRPRSATRRARSATCAVPARRTGTSRSSRTSRFKERLKAQFRAEALNAFNSPLFHSPITNISNGPSDRSTVRITSRVSYSSRFVSHFKRLVVEERQATDAPAATRGAARYATARVFNGCLPVAMLSVTAVEVWWPGTELNRRHADFQSAALPAELPGRGKLQCSRSPRHAFCNVSSASPVCLLHIRVQTVAVRVHRHDRREILHPQMPHRLRNAELQQMHAQHLLDRPRIILRRAADRRSDTPRRTPSAPPASSSPCRPCRSPPARRTRLITSA